IEAIMWAIAGAITGGEIEIKRFPVEALKVPLVFLEHSGMRVFHGKDSIFVRGGNPYPLEFSTGTYPGINSDLQPLLAVYGAHAEGITTVVDLRFPERFGYAYE